MVVTNRLWDSVNGFRFQNVILVFHDGFCAVFEDSAKGISVIRCVSQRGYKGKLTF